MPASAPRAELASLPQSRIDGAYAASGVSIDAGNHAVELMKSAVKSTYGPEVLTGIGAFGGLYDAAALTAHASAGAGRLDGRGRHQGQAGRAGRALPLHRAGYRQPLHQRYPGAGRAPAVLPGLFCHLETASPR